MTDVIQIYTDGACSGNPGRGGWGAILLFKGKEKRINGASISTTNNRMELMAVICALKTLKRTDIPVEVYSDSAYVVNAFNQGWVSSWRDNGWQTNSKKPVQNREMWDILASLVDRLSIKFIKVKGHSDNKYNNECDALARSAIASL